MDEKQLQALVSKSDICSHRRNLIHINITIHKPIHNYSRAMSNYDNLAPWI